MRRATPLAAGAALLSVVLHAPQARAEPVHGRLRLEIAAAWEDMQSVGNALGARSRGDLRNDLRLTWSPQWGAWKLDTAYVLDFDAGNTPGFLAREAALGLLPPAPPPTLLNLSNTLANEPDFSATQRIDRLSLTYTGTHVVLRVGRQALTWGAGLVFHPMDLIDPFAPQATDTEYKPGTDMVYAQYLFDSGADLQFVAAPRPARPGGAPAADASSFALHLHLPVAAWQTTWLVARDRGDWVAAAGLGGAWAGASWNAEAVPTFVRGGGTYTSLLFNISDAGTLWDRDVTYFAEYYRNGFGLAATHYALGDLPAPLRDRLARGQVFDTGRDYLALGSQLQWTPLLQISPTLIANLNDGSLYGLVQADYSLGNNFSLVAGSQTPIGPHNAEFGGIALAPNAPLYFEAPNTLYLQARYYF